MAKNAELEKAATNNRKLKLFKPEILQLTADELNYSLCLFVKEVRKPNGSEYAPDTIYYLCLGKWVEQVVKLMTLLEQMQDETATYPIELIIHDSSHNLVLFTCPKFWLL
jgi:hypothetical protein